MAKGKPAPGYQGAFIGELLKGGKIWLDEKHFAAIGRVAAAWGILEYAIDFAINHLNNDGEERGYCVTSQIQGAGNKMKAFLSIAAYHQLDAKKLSKFEAMSQKLFGLADRRNRVVHDVWIVHETSQLHFRHQLVEKNGKLILENRAVDLGEIEQLLNDITKFRLDFVNQWMSLPSSGMFPSTSILLLPHRRPEPTESA